MNSLCHLLQSFIYSMYNKYECFYYNIVEFHHRSIYEEETEMMDCCPCCSLNQGRSILRGGNENTTGGFCKKDYVPHDDFDIEGDMGPVWSRNPWILPSIGVVGVLGGVLGVVGTYFGFYRTVDLTFRSAHNPDSYKNYSPYPGR